MRVSPQPRGVRRGITLGAIGVALVLMTSCSTTTRPATEAWQTQWERQQNSLPEPGAFVAGDTQFCDTLDSNARVNLPQLLPTPDAILDKAVTAWIKQAERLAFECPHSRAEVDTAFRTLEILAGEVDGALAVVTEQ